MFRRFAPRKDISSLLFASKSSLFQQCFFEVSSANHRRRSKETWKFWRLAPQKDLLSSDFESKTSMSHQNFFEDSSTTLTKIKWSTKETSMFGRLAQHNFYWSIMFASNSPLCIKISSKNHQWSSSEISNFQRLAQKKTKTIYIVCSQIIALSSRFAQRSINKVSLKQQWNINVSQISRTKTKH